MPDSVVNAVLIWIRSAILSGGGVVSYAPMTGWKRLATPSYLKVTEVWCFWAVTVYGYRDGERHCWGRESSRGPDLGFRSFFAHDGIAM